MEKIYDVAIIGSGPGGYVAAIRASQLGLKVACIERAEVGGICLNWGCIPTKALLKNADVLQTLKASRRFGISYENLDVDFIQVVKRSRGIASRLSKGVEYLFKKNDVEHISGTGYLKSSNIIEVRNPDGEHMQDVSAKNIIVATGARARMIPGIDLKDEHILTSREALELYKVPESIAVIGAGAIGVEFAHIYNSFGADVTLVEMLPRIVPVEDEEVTEIIDAGAKYIGENYVQEAENIYIALGEKSKNVQWHMIGHLQSNKINKALKVFDLIQSVDSLKKAEGIDKRVENADRKQIPVLIEINIGSEISKSGIPPEYEIIESLAKSISTLEHLRLEGLMTLGPLSGDPEDVRPYFRKIKEYFDRIKDLNIPQVNMKTLSMGMTNSYRVAIEEGANMVRIGTAIFGPRKYKI